jgi:hypothetical protein
LIRYCSTAALLSLGWFLVLLLPRLTRQWLLADVSMNVALFMATGLAVALIFRRFIASAQTFRRHIQRAVIVPLSASLVYLTLWAAVLWVKQLFLGGLANLHDTLSLYVSGLLATLLCLPVILPYGLVCQYVLASVHSRDER